MAKALLDNRFAPLTYSWGFLEAPFQQVGDEAVQWTKSIFTKVDILHFKKPLADALSSLEPLITPPRKKLLLNTQSGWVAYFDNGTDGGDPSSFVGYMSERLKCRGLAVSCIPHTFSGNDKKAKGTHRAVIFKLYAPEKRDWLNLERSISMVNDYGKWIFETTGTVQPFEKTEKYRARAVKDRFTAELLEQYCADLTVRIFDENTYGPEGILISIGDPLPSGFAAVSLAEARERLGLDQEKNGASFI